MPAGRTIQRQSRPAVLQPPITELAKDRAIRGRDCGDSCETLVQAIPPCRRSPGHRDLSLISLERGPVRQTGESSALPHAMFPAGCEHGQGPCRTRSERRGRPPSGRHIANAAARRALATSEVLFPMRHPAIPPEGPTTESVVAAKQCQRPRAPRARQRPGEMRTSGPNSPSRGRKVCQNLKGYLGQSGCSYRTRLASWDRAWPWRSRGLRARNVWDNAGVVHRAPADIRSSRTIPDRR